MDAHRPAAPAGGYFGGLGGGSITSRAIQPLLDSDPRQIGPYAIRGRLGQGAMGHVYLAFAPTGPAYALKVLRPDFASDSDFRRRFAREIAAARAVHSPFVNAVTDADPDAPTPWLASYFIPGPPLNAAVNLAGPFSSRSVAHLGVGIGLALQAIHTAGVVHRDLKPGNVLVASDGPRVIDFGIARAADASMLTSTGMRLGTPSFMAPEQVSGSNVGAAADVWAVGGMLVYAATGRTPFGDGNAMAILYRVENHEPDLEDLDPALAAIVERCLEKDPEARPSPAKLVELCRAALYGGAEGIPVLPGTDSTGWLPPAISRDLASRAVELASVRQMQVGIPVSGGGTAGAVGTAAGAAGAAGAMGGAGGSVGGKARGLLGRKAKGGAAARPAQAGVGPQGYGAQGAGPLGAGPQGSAPQGGPVGPAGGVAAAGPQGPQNYGQPGGTPGPQNYGQAGPRGYGPPAAGAPGPQNYGQPGVAPGPQNYGAPAGAAGAQNYGAPAGAPPRTVPEGSPAPTLPLSAPGPAVGSEQKPADGPATPAVSTPSAAPAASATPAFTPPAAPLGSPADPDEPKGPAWATALSNRPTAEPARSDLDSSLISTPSDEAARGPAAAGSMPWNAAPPIAEPGAADVVAADTEAAVAEEDAAEPAAPTGPFGPTGSLDARPSAGEAGVDSDDSVESAASNAEAADAGAADASPSPLAGLPAGFRQIEEEPKKVAEVKSAFAAPAPPVAADGADEDELDGDSDADTSSTADDLLSSFGSPVVADAEPATGSDVEPETERETETEPAAEPETKSSAPLFAAPLPPKTEGADPHDVTTPLAADAHEVTTPLAAESSKWASAKSEPVASPWTAPVSGTASSAHDVTVVNARPAAKTPPVPQPAASFAPPTHPTSPTPPNTGAATSGAPSSRGPAGPGGAFGPSGPGGPGAPGGPNPGFGPATPPPSHLTVVPPPPSMSSPYGQPGGPGTPTYDDRSYGGSGRPPGGPTGLRNKRVLLIVAAAAAVVAVGAGAVAMSGGGGNTPVANPTVTSAPTTPAASRSSTPGQDSSTPTPPPASTSALTGVPGKTPGVVGAQDVVLRGLYAAAADRDFPLICSSISVANQQLAAKAQGWNGKGDPVPMCVKFYETVWGKLDPAHLRAVKVLSAQQGADAKHYTITVDDLSEDGKPTRGFKVSWNGQRWLIG